MPRRMIHRRPERRVEAESRQQAYNTLTVQQKIDRANARQGNSAVEIARLEVTLG